MEYAAAVDQLRRWRDEDVVVVIEPDHSVMSGRLHELDSTGTDGALFAVDNPQRKTSGVAIALFRDAFAEASLDPKDGSLHVHQGRVEIIVRRQRETAAPPPAH
jgi:hypothetical protein